MEEQKTPLSQELMEVLRSFRRVHSHQHILLGGNLNSSEFSVLHKIAHHAKTAKDGHSTAISPSDISQDLHVSSPTVTQHITSLEVKGYIVREIDKHDRRKIRITLTPEGETCLKEAKRSMMSSFDGLVDHLGVKETQQFIMLLKKSTDYFRERNLLGPDNCCKEFQGGEKK